MASPASERVEVAGARAASDSARRLLADLGARVATVPGPDDPHPALAWANSGAMALTGRPEALPRARRAPARARPPGADTAALRRELSC